MINHGRRGHGDDSGSVVSDRLIRFTVKGTTKLIECPREDIFICAIYEIYFATVARCVVHFDYSQLTRKTDRKGHFFTIASLHFL